MFSYILSKRPANLFVGLIFFTIFVKITKMEKRSTHWADVLKWLKIVVDSCKTREQADTCDRLIRNFHRVYEKQLGTRETWDLTREMERKLWDIGEWTLKEKIKNL